MGLTKNLVIDLYPVDVETPDDFDEWSQEYDTAMKTRQADEPHSPACG